MKRTRDGTRLMVAASEHDADMLYALVIPSGVEEPLIRRGNLRFAPDALLTRTIAS